MNARLFTAFLVLCGAPLLAQTPSPSSYSHLSDLGFAYSIPADWEVVDTKASLPDVKQKQAQTATSDEEKKGIECVQVALTARHGTPASVIVVVQLPYACFGQPMTEKDLPGFAQGASEGLKKTFNMTNPVYGAYTLGTHSLWIDRAKGTIKDHPEAAYTIETVCSLLKNGAVCWMAMAADNAGLETFEHGNVTLDGEAPAALVPSTAFDKQPAS